MKKKLLFSFVCIMNISTNIVALKNTIKATPTQPTPVQPPSLANQLPKLAGPAQQGGVVDLQPSDQYLNKSTRDFDPTGVETITQHNLIGVYKNAVILDIPPRRMWGWGGTWSGYCGSMSFQMCGIYFGNLVSEEIVRYAANAQDTQVLVGVNDVVAAQALQYTYDSYNGATVDDFITWIKNHIDSGHPILLGVYQYHKPQEQADPDYDHIVPIVGYSFDTNNQVNGLYFYDLYLKNYTLINGATYADFKNNCFKTRQQAWMLNQYQLPGINGAPITSSNPILPSYAQGKNGQVGYEICAFTYAVPIGTQYALAITGIANQSKQPLLWTKLTVSAWNEPDWGFEEKKNEPAVDFNCNAIVYGLTPGQSYTIFRFEPTINTTAHTIDPTTIPVSNYQNAKYTQKINFVAPSATAKINVGSLKSNKAYFFRTIQGQF